MGFKLTSFTRSKLSTYLVKDHDFSTKMANEFVDSFFDEIASALGHGFNISLPEFGNFSLSDKKKRVARNVKISDKTLALAPVRRVVNFKAAEKVKKQIRTELEKKKP